MIEISEETIQAAREIGFKQGLANVLPLHVCQYLYKRYKDQIDKMEEDKWGVLINLNHTGANLETKWVMLQNPRVWDWDLVWQVASLISTLECFEEYLQHFMLPPA